MYGISIKTNKELKLRVIVTYDPETSLSTLYHLNPDNLYIPRHQWNGNEDSDITPIVPVSLQKLKEILRNSIFCSPHGYFDHYHILKSLGIRIKIRGDSYIYTHLIPDEPRHRRDMESLMKRIVDPDYTKFRYGDQDSFDWDAEFLTTNLMKYAFQDARGAYLIEKSLKENHPEVADKIYQLELGLIPVLSEMRLKGIRVDKDLFDKSLNMHEQLRKAKLEEVSKLNGSPIRINSTIDIAKLVYDKLHYKCTVLTKAGKRAVSKDVLHSMGGKNIKTILDAKHIDYVSREFHKIYQMREIEKKDNTLIFHPEFKPINESGGGRIYTINPSLNQWTWEMRDCVVPDNPDNLFYYADIVAGEMMIIAYGAEEEGAIKEYDSGLDFHTTMAMEIYDSSKEEIQPWMRENAKTISFAIVYGENSESLATELNVPLPEIENLKRTFMKKYPKIVRFMRKIGEEVQATGRVATKNGRWRLLVNAMGCDQITKARAVRQAFNFYAQSGLADLQKLTLINLENAEVGRLKFTVFDSFLVEIEKESHKGILDRIILNSLKLDNGGLRIRSGTGSTWTKAKNNAK